MNCNCNCKYFSFVNNASLSGQNIVLGLNNVPTIVDGKKFCFRFRCGVAIPTGSSTYPVYVSINGANYPVWNKYGNIMTGAELTESSTSGIYCPRKTYHSYFGLVDDDYHIIVHNVPVECNCGA